MIKGEFGEQLDFNFFGGLQVGFGLLCFGVQRRNLNVLHMSDSKEFKSSKKIGLDLCGAEALPAWAKAYRKPHAQTPHTL